MLAFPWYVWTLLSSFQLLGWPRGFLIILLHCCLFCAALINSIYVCTGRSELVWFINSCSLVASCLLHPPTPVSCLLVFSLVFFHVLGCDQALRVVTLFYYFYENFLGLLNFSELVHLSIFQFSSCHFPITPHLKCLYILPITFIHCPYFRTVGFYLWYLHTKDLFP